MGLFSKLKDDVTHGGVKVKVSVPESVPSNGSIPVTVTITSDSSKLVNGIKAELKSQAREEGMLMGSPGIGTHVGGMGMQESRTPYQTIAQVESRESFTINPGESKTVNLQLYLNGTSGNSTNPQGNGGGVMGGLLKTLGNLERVNYIYRVEVSAQVDGVGIDPSDKQAIQLVPSSQTGDFAQATPQSFAPTQPVIPAEPGNPTYTQPQPPTEPAQNIDPGQNPPTA